jgi:anti-sigma B factor antagonist
MSANGSGPAPPLSVRDVAGTTVVALHGEIDLFMAPRLTAHLDALTAGPGSDLVVDLGAVSFIDCTGLGVLCRARNRVLARQGRLRLVADSARLRRVLRIAGLAGVFEVHPRLSEALTLPLPRTRTRAVTGP